MTQVTHPEMVATLCKPGADIVESLDLKNWAVLVAAITNATAASDTLDKAKKQVIYNKPMGITATVIRTMPSITAEQAHLLHMAIGIYGEAGELLDAVANHVIHGAPLDVANVREEGGDLEFYMEGLRQGLEAERDDWLQGNIDKLSVRYEGLQYSDQAAQARADKQDGVILPGGGEVASTAPADSEMDTSGASVTNDENPIADQSVTDTQPA